ncbi:hypothetical protein SAMN05444166_4090 [Singulisphaera sp. GP187]|uniref:hypothetical protein n=1 Tax=Singulisphaera sp. GP187 TaxID=1882752 RepID=UPI000929457F|nr:hypothetical protein [Singulisphaera sp. GP187]SIO36089.1 hypothetical protein SAMN05444166_4090 [Singulisphaera sp. GP187]
MMRSGALAPIRNGLLFGVALFAVLSSAGSADGGDPPGTAMIELGHATVVIPAQLPDRERKAVTMLVEEVGRRTRLNWVVTTDWPEAPGPVVVVTPARALATFSGKPGGDRGPEPPARSEGYRVWVAESTPVVWVEGHDARGVLFGVGRLLRELRMSRGRVDLPASFRVSSSPRDLIRGHQLGYRPKTNSYDGWDLDQWERYIRDLAVFGTNAIELLPPETDDAADSPHFPRPPLEMMVGMSKLVDDYGLDVWVWYPVPDNLDAQPEAARISLERWAEVLGKLPRVDAVFVPGGDPGHSRPSALMPHLEKAAAVLRKAHPNAQMWVSTQGFDRAWTEEFYAIVGREPAWLSGVVYGPHTRDSLAEVRAGVPRRYPVRLYPDITHTMKCQFPVPDWDLAYFVTEGREPINPRPRANAEIFKALKDHVGFVTYSEGCNDDVNKFVWSALGFDPETPVVEILRQYSRYFIGPKTTEGFAQGLLALEQNWVGPLSGNDSVETTLQQFQDLERQASPDDLRNWRFQQALYRAYYDALVRDRLVFETGLENQAMADLRRARAVGSIDALNAARATLDRAKTTRLSADRRGRVFELGEALFQSIRMQLSVPRYQAIGEERGANLDSIDAPLNNRVWLEAEFDRLRALPDEAARQQGIEQLIQRTNPGPGGFYDAPGDPTRRPHVEPGPSVALDPMLRVARQGFQPRPDWPLTWYRHAESLYDVPLRMNYDDLDPRAHYSVRVVYAGDRGPTPLELKADGLVVHAPIPKSDPVRPLEFAIPPQATADGRLTLTWTRDPGRGGNGRGCQVTEVWLIRKGD